MNVASLKKYVMVGKITRHMEGRKIDIACIQETHFDAQDMVRNNDYNIYFRHGENQDNHKTENQQKINGGVAIAIREIKNIYQINRFAKRIIEI